MPHRQWRIRAVVLFPKQLVAADPPGPGHLLPARLELLSRVPVEQRDLGTARIAIRPTTHPLLPPREGLEDQFEAAELLVELHAESAFEAIERAHPLLELVLDRLAFDMQIALSVIQTDVTDVTPPIAAGDERDFSTFASYPGDKFARAEDVGSTFAKQVPHLHDSYGEPSPRVRAALRWYIKALGAPLLHDRFIFLWIAVEIFADDSGIEISGALPLRCGHVLKECPECQKPTARKIRGASIRAFLQARGADPDVAKSAWTLRQMLHGHSVRLRKARWLSGRGASSARHRRCRVEARTRAPSGIPTDDRLRRHIRSSIYGHRRIQCDQRGRPHLACVIAMTGSPDPKENEDARCASRRSQPLTVPAPAISGAAARPRSTRPDSQPNRVKNARVSG